MGSILLLCCDRAEVSYFVPFKLIIFSTTTKHILTRYVDSRALFLLHVEFLRQHRDHLSEGQLRASHAALDTATQIMVDIASSHESSITVFEIDSLPPTCIFNIHTSIECLREKSILYDKQVTPSVRSLQNFLQIFTRRWLPGPLISQIEHEI